MRVVQEGIESGELRPEISPLLIRAVIYGSVESVAWRFLYRRKPIDIEQIADPLTDTICVGIARQPAREDVSGAVGKLARLVDEFRELVAQAGRRVRTPNMNRKSGG